MGPGQQHVVFRDKHGRFRLHRRGPGAVPEPDGCCSAGRVDVRHRRRQARRAAEARLSSPPPCSWDSASWLSRHTNRSAERSLTRRRQQLLSLANGVLGLAEALEERG